MNAPDSRAQTQGASGTVTGGNERSTPDGPDKTSDDLYVHPDDVDIDAMLRAPNGSFLMATEIRWLRRQRSILAAALDRGDGDDPTYMAAAALFEVGVAKVDTTTSDGTGRSTASLTLEAMVDAAADRLTLGEFESNASYDRCGETLCTSDAWGVARAVLDAAGVPAMVAASDAARNADETTGGDV